MKVMSVKIGGKTYTTDKITAYMSRQAIKVNAESVKLSKTATDDNVVDVYAELENILDKKNLIICQVFGDKFTAEELENNLSRPEIDEMFNNIMTGITGTIEKN